MLKIMIGTLALALAAAPAAAASLAIEPARDTREVRFDDLNLASPAGLASLERRIERAARDLCGIGGTEHIAGLRAQQAARICFAETKATATQQVAAARAERARGG